MARKNAKTTIYSLSRDLDVSPATVSKALRGSAEISAELRRKITQLAEKKRFRPRVVSRKVPNLCILIQQYAGHNLDFGRFTATVMEGVAQYTREEGLEMSLFADDIISLNRCDIVREMSRRSIDGAVVLRSTNESQYLAALDAERFPHYALLSTSMLHPDHVIGINNMKVGYRATKHLLDRGHRHIDALVSPPMGITGQDRFAGYRLAMEEAGLPVQANLVEHESASETALEFGLRGVNDLVDRNPDMTAFFAMDHGVAIGALHGLYRRGISCPRDMSVISCDDFPETAYLQPPLTVVDIPNQRLGYLAARQVYRAMRHLEPLDLSAEIDLSGRVIERESVASPRAHALPGATK